MYKNNLINIVIPAYNEERFIAGVLSAIPDYIDKIIVVDDCSRFRTRQFNLCEWHGGRGPGLLLFPKTNREI